jgi:hypothetical protein
LATSRSFAPPAETKRLGDALVKAAAYASTSIRGSASELDGFDRTMDQARAVHSFGNRPLIVLTAMAPMKPEQLKGLGLKAEEGDALQAGMEERSTPSRRPFRPAAASRSCPTRPIISRSTAPKS